MPELCTIPAYKQQIFSTSGFSPRAVISVTLPFFLVIVINNIFSAWPTAFWTVDLTHKTQVIQSTLYSGSTRPEFCSY